MPKNCRVRLCDSNAELIYFDLHGDAAIQGAELTGILGVPEPAFVDCPTEVAAPRW
jgi:hypothetical protein